MWRGHAVRVQVRHFAAKRVGGSSSGSGFDHQKTGLNHMADEQRPEDERPEDENIEQQEGPEGGAGEQAEAGAAPPDSGPGTEPDEEDEEEEAREDLDDLTVLQDTETADLDAVESSGAGDDDSEDLTNLSNINMGSQQTTDQVIGGLIPDDAPPVPGVFVDPEPFEPQGNPLPDIDLNDFTVTNESRPPEEVDPLFFTFDNEIERPESLEEPDEILEEDIEDPEGFDEDPEGGPVAQPFFFIPPDDPLPPPPPPPPPAPVPVLDVVDAIVDEDDLLFGTDGSDSLTVTQPITIDLGGSGFADLRFSALTTDDLDNLGLTANNETISYSLDVTGRTITAESSDGDPIFTITLNVNNDGTYAYTFTLEGNIDHDFGDGENVQNFPFEFEVENTDGIVSTDTFTVGVIDDVPVANPDSVSVDEDDLADGTDATKESLSVTGDLNIEYGADSQLASASFVSTNSLDALGLTSGGVAIDYAITNGGQTIEATAGGNPVFTIDLNQGGTYTFTLQDSLDHQSGSGQNTQNLPFTVTLVDGDGDESDVSFNVSVVDDVPEAAEVATPQVADTVTLDEDDLSDGTDDTKESLSASGDLGLDG
ncbi:MAG: hypothetical protein RJQ21_14715, partial [Rhodospirillales bacterium]